MRRLMVSGYGSGGSATIAEYRLSDDGLDVEEIWNDDIESPSYLSIHKDMCFALTGREKEGVLYCYRKGSDEYTLTDHVDVAGGTLCHITYSPKHNLLFGACYGTGHVMAVAVENFRFAEVRNLFVIQPDDHQGITRAHCCVPDPAENRVFVCNIALDRVYVYDIVNGALKANEALPYLQLDKGEGPRHIRFHPQMDIAYVITEYSNRIIVMFYDKTAGALYVIQTVSVLPEGFVGKSFCSTLTFSPDGRILYAANRGADTIAVFAIDEEGLLQKIQDFDCGGKWPRHIDITADGRHLLVANQWSGNVAVLSVAQRDGRLERHVRDIPFKEPSFVAEVL